MNTHRGDDMKGYELSGAHCSCAARPKLEFETPRPGHVLEREFTI
jgi:hypothetical protein